MALLKSYDTAQAFLIENEKFLLSRELVHNLILGICYSLVGKTDLTEKYHFLSVGHNDVIMALAIKTGPKVLIAGATYQPNDLKLMADYFKTNNIQVNGVLGETLYSEIFAGFYKSGKSSKLLLHGLNQIVPSPAAEGQFLVGSEQDEGELLNMLFDYNKEVSLLGDRSIDQVLQILREQIKSRNLYIWKKAGVLVSMAAVLRKTKSYALVGNVYTPPAHRNKNFASSCVRKLSKHLLHSGFQGCGLFTDAANPASNKIYKAIGYQPLSEFSDIQLL